MNKLYALTAAAWTTAIVLAVVIIAAPAAERVVVPPFALALALAATTSIPALLARVLPAPLAAYLLGRDDRT